MAQEFAVYLQETGSFPSAFYPKKHNLWAKGMAVSSVRSPNCFTKGSFTACPSWHHPCPHPRAEEAASSWDLLWCIPSFISFILYFVLVCLFLRILTAAFYYFTIRDFEGGSIKEVGLKYSGCSQLSHLQRGSALRPRRSQIAAVSTDCRCWPSLERSPIVHLW